MRHIATSLADDAAPIFKSRFLNQDFNSYDSFAHLGFQPALTGEQHRKLKLCFGSDDTHSHWYHNGKGDLNLDICGTNGVRLKFIQ